MDTRVPDDPGPTSADGGEATRPEDEDGGLHRSAADTVDALLDEVELALARLDDGTYGRCETCGAVIDDAVLAADPVVRSCGACPEESPSAAGEAATAPVG